MAKIRKHLYTDIAVQVRLPLRLFSWGRSLDLLPGPVPVCKRKRHVTDICIVHNSGSQFMLCQAKESQSVFKRSDDLDVAAAVVAVVAVSEKAYQVGAQDMEAR